MHSIPPGRLRAFRVTLALIVVAAWSGAFHVLRTAWHRHQDSGVQVTSSWSGPESALWRGQREYLIDEVCGHRPVPDTEVEFVMRALGGSTQERIHRRFNNHGFLREDDVDDGERHPRILLIGDSHMVGVVDGADNAAHLLELDLQGQEATANAQVLNAAAANYNVYHYPLRIRTLRERWRPDVVVAVVFLGNDFVTLDDASMPLIDDDLEEHPPPADPTPRTRNPTRKKYLELMPKGLFFQGLDQVSYLHENPERTEPLLRKTRRAFELLVDECEAAGAELLVLGLPAYFMIKPKAVRALGPEVRAALDSWDALDWTGRLEQILADLSVHYVDLTETFRAAPRDNLFAADYHIYTAGHALVAEECARALQPMLRAE